MMVRPMMKDKKILASVGGALLIALALALFTTVKVKAQLAVNDTDIVNISVQIATKTMVDVNPAALTWIGVDPGSVGGPSQEIEGPNYFAIQIENIGSHNITHIWFNATYPASRPFASGTNSTYDAGNFVALRREGATTDFYFPNRLEFNESRSIVYLRDPSGNLPPSSAYSYGRFRNTSYEYFWMVSRGANCDGQTFYIGEDPHTESATGTTNFQGATTADDGVCVVSLQASTARPGWCYSDLPDSSNDPDCAKFNYAVYVKNETYDQVFFVHWNKDFSDTSNKIEYFYEGNLVPGDSSIAYIRVYVPYGVYEGYVKTCLLYTSPSPRDGLLSRMPSSA